jgi:hypothetical protein
MLPFQPEDGVLAVDEDPFVIIFTCADFGSFTVEVRAPYQVPDTHLLPDSELCIRILNSRVWS